MMPRYVIKKETVGVALRFNGVAFWSAAQSTWRHEIAFATHYKKHEVAESVAFKLAATPATLQKVFVEPSGKYENRRWFSYSVTTINDPCIFCKKRGKKDVYACRKKCADWPHRHATCRNCDYCAMIVPLVSDPLGGAGATPIRGTK